jgi:hypothetical protein
MDKQNNHLLLRVPTPGKQGLSFCDATPRDLRRWIAGLPKANLGETARLLYQGLVEINQLLTRAEIRLQLLELLRPEVYFVCKQMERHFLNQAIVLDERPRKVANLCQALQNHLAIGYKLVIVREVTRVSRDREALLSMALQRAVHSLCGPLIRASQLYCPVPEGLWLELHQLYRIARHHALHQNVVPDELSRNAQGLSVEQSYLVALMLGCARCNQMRQGGIAHLAKALEDWSNLIVLQGTVKPASLFVVSLQIDGPPRYKSLHGEDNKPPQLGIDTRPLVDAIENYLALPVEERGKATLYVPEEMSPDLLQHLAAAWGDIAERSFQRTPGRGTLTLCIGMSALHFYLANRQHFNEILKRQEQKTVFKPLVSGQPDIWANAFDAQVNQNWENGLPFEDIKYSRPNAPAEEEPSAKDLYPLFELSIVNHSPGGYCLSWSGEVPGQLQTGELLGIQDAPDMTWSVAVVRWIRQVRGGGTEMGIEMIAPQAQPCGLQLVRKNEQGSQFLRALLLPEITAISRPASLLTPRLPFQEGNKVIINLHGEETRAVLSRRQNSTGSFSQFEYRKLEQNLPPSDGKPVTAPSKSGKSAEEDFDSLWKSL